MKELAYISTPDGLVFDDDVLGVLQVSRRRNLRLGITGLLLYDAEHFFQLIEGEDAVVDTLFRAIAADTRHRDVRVLSEGPIARRSFAAWSMDYRRIDARLHDMRLLTGERRERVGPTLAHMFG